MAKDLRNNLVGGYCLLSFIVPVHDAAGTIRKCVESLAEHQDIPCEVILVENGSKDDSFEICHELTERYQTVTALSIPKADVNQARNAGFEASQGTFVAFVDADDWVHPSFSKTLVSEAEKSGADVVRCGYSRVLSSHALLRDDRRAYQECRVENPQTQSRYETLSRFLNPTAHGFTPSGLWGGIFRRELFGSIPLEIRENGLRRKEDMLVCSHAFALARKILFIPNCLYMYRYGGVTSTSFRVIGDLRRYYELMIQTHELSLSSDFPLMWREVCLYVVETVHDAYFALSVEGDQGIWTFYQNALADSFVQEAAAEAVRSEGELAETAQLILYGDVNELVSFLHNRLRLRRIKSNLVRIAARTGLL